MRITRSTGPVAPSGGSRPQAAGGFAPTASAGPAASAVRSAAAAPLAGLDALLALQAQGGPLERRRRAVARAGRLLDGLDAVKLALLGGGSERGALEDLARAVGEMREGVDDLALANVLDEIETRAAVEIAKRESRAAA